MTNSADSLLPGCRLASSQHPVPPDSPASHGQPAENVLAGFLLSDDLLRSVVAPLLDRMDRIAAAAERTAAMNERIAAAFAQVVGSKVNEGLLSADGRLARQRRLPHILLPDRSLRFDWEEIKRLVLHVPAGVLHQEEAVP